MSTASSLAAVRTEARRPKSADPDDPYLSVPEAVATGRYGSASTLTRRIQAGAFPSAIMVGHTRFILQSELDRFGGYQVQPLTPSVDTFEQAVQRALAAAPPLTDEQITELAAIFSGSLRARSVRSRQRREAVRVA